MKKYQGMARLTSILLVFLFIFSPVAATIPAAAAETPAGTTADNAPGGQTASAPTAENITTNTAPQASAPAPSATQVLRGSDYSPDIPQTDAAAAPAPALSAGSASPSDTGTIGNGSAPAGSEVDPMSKYYAEANKSSSNGVKTDQQTGAMTYSVPIVTPPGRNGFNLGLELSYNSQSNALDGPFGNWNINIPSISRINRFGTDKLFSTPLFETSLDGELGTTSDPTIFLAKFEQGSFYTHTFDPASNSWTMKDKQGTVYTFGSTAASRQDNPSDSTQVFRWMVDQIQDTNGNIVKYTYYKENGDIYPDTISFTNDASGNFFHRVVFLHGPSGKSVKSAAAGFVVETDTHITEIDVFSGTHMNARYVPNYTNNTPDNIFSIYRDFFDVNGNKTSQNLNFTYSTYSATAASKTWQYNPVDRTAPANASFNYLPGIPGRKIADVNGDGRPDIIVAEQQQTPSVSGGPRYLISDNHVYLSKGTSWVEDPNWQWPEAFVNDLGQSVKVTFSDINGIQTGLTVLDVNGDGLADLVQAVIVQDGSTFVRRNKVFINNGHGWVEDPTWQFPTDPMTFANGSIAPGPLVIQKAVELPTLQTTRYNAQTTIQSDERPYVFDSMTELTNTFVADINGDGLPDVVRQDTNCANCMLQNEVFLNTGHGWQSSASWQFPSGLTLSSKTMRLLDINGDGLADFLVLPAGHWNNNNPPVFVSSNDVAYINTGSGWTADSKWTFGYSSPFANNGTSMNYGNPQFEGFNDKPTAMAASPGSPVVITNEPDSGLRVMDVNGDGLPDMLWCIGYKEFTSSNPADVRFGLLCEVFINFGNGWGGGSQWTLPIDSNLWFSQLSDWSLRPQPVFVNTTFKYDVDNGQYTYFSIPSGVQFEDFNDDGMVDFVHAGNQSNGQLAVQVFENQFPKQDLLTAITLPTGGKINITYATTASLRDSQGNQLNPNLPANMFVVSKVETDDGFGNLSDTAYTYYDGKYYYNGPYDKKFAGFHIVKQTNPDGSLVYTYFHQGDSTDTGAGEFQDSVDKIGKIYRIEKLDSGGHWYAKTLFKWGGIKPGINSYFVKLLATLNSSYDGNMVSHRDTLDHYDYDDTNGNITKVYQMGEVSTVSDDWNYTDVGSDEKDTTISYTSGNGISLPSDEIITSIGNKIKETRFYYDGLPLGSATVGNLTKQEQWVAGTTYTNTQKTYGVFGLTATDIDQRGKTTRYLYDANTLYLATVTSPLPHFVTNYGYDYGTGKTIVVIDPNNFISRTYYDGLGRVVRETVPDAINPDSQITKTTYDYNDFPNQVSLHKAAFVQNGVPVDSYQYFDGLGRKIQDRTAVNGTNFSVKDYAYNNQGLLQKESLPYFSSGTAKTAATTIPALYTNYTYDPLQRLFTTSNAVGTASNTYNQWKLTVTDANGKSKDLSKDAFGNLVEVDEHNGGNTYVTTYTYDGLNNLIKITDALGNVRNFTYDGLGRRLTAEDLHAPADTTFGTWAYSYDDAGNVTSKVDPKNQTVNYTYDDINRPLTEDFTGQSGTEVSYGYDSCADGVGRLCGATSTAASLAYVYNPLGQMVRETKTIDGTPYVTGYAYDMQGNMLQLTNPDTSSVLYTYNVGGLLSQVKKKDVSDSAFSSVVNSFSYAPTGQVASIQFANGAVTTNTYDPTQVYRLAAKVTAVASTTPQNLAYTYDLVGNITKIVDASNTHSSKTMLFTYDDLNRMLSATATGTTAGMQGYARTYAYDAIGNITNSSVDGAYAYTGNQGNSFANPHAVTGIGTTNYNYDQNGNLVAETGRIYNWDYNNRLLATNLLSGGATTTIASAYDVNGQRVKYTTPAGTTYYPTEYFNVDSTGKTTKHIFAGGLLLADMVSGTSGGGSSCTPPSSGDWTLSASCTLTGTQIAPASVIVNAGVLLTVSPGSKLLIDLKHFKLLVKKTGGVLVKKTAVVRQVKSGDVATTNPPSGPQLVFVHTDHLGSPTILTDATGALAEVLDYYPYGDSRLDEKNGMDEQRKYIGQEYDAATGLDYLNARYYNSKIGKFISEDSQFILASFSLSDPQNFNSYSYSRNNPITNSDPTGQFSFSPFDYLPFEKEAAIGNWVNDHPSISWLVEHPYVPAIVGSAPLAIYGAVAAAPYVTSYAADAGLWALANLQTVTNIGIGVISGGVSKVTSDHVNGEQINGWSVGLSMVSGGLAYPAGQSSNPTVVTAGLSFMTSVASDIIEKKSIDWSGAAYQSAIDAGTTYVIDKVPDVSGRKAQSFSTAITSARTTREVTNSGIGYSFGLFADVIKQPLFNAAHSVWNWITGK